MDSRDAIIEELRALVAKQAARIAELEAELQSVKLALAKAQKDSSTSSKPPGERHRQAPAEERADRGPASVVKAGSPATSGIYASRCRRSESTKRSIMRSTTPKSGDSA